MKLLTLLTLTLTSSAAVQAADDPRACPKNGPLDTSLFTLQHTTNKHLPALHDVFASKDKNVSVSSVLASSNRALVKSKPPDGTGPLSFSYAWNSGDAATSKWTPQGITSSADASDTGKYEDKESLLVSWYSNEGDGNARISFVDRATGKYRHALLVEPVANEDFVSMGKLHAGGITWVGDQLYVVDTWGGVRVFDLSKIWEVEIGDGIGKGKGGEYTAAGYRFVVPQTGFYKWTPGKSSKYRFSWISLDRSESTILIGEFNHETRKNPTRFTKYPISLSTGALESSSKGIVESKFAYCVDFEAMQGGFSLKDTIYVSRSNGKSPKAGDLIKWTPGKTAEIKKGWFMAGNEDLSFNPVKKEYYTVSEYEKARYVLGYKF